MSYTYTIWLQTGCKVSLDVKNKYVNLTSFHCVGISKRILHVNCNRVRLTFFCV